MYWKSWVENDLALWFGDQVIPVSIDVADKWGFITAHGNFSAIDSLIAATALTHNMKLVTRNVADFKSIAGLEIINPWNY
jgi:predicted nucleic acid-binding protein